MARIAIVGAGIAGLTLARGLVPDHDVTIFEKSRGPGGRMATRYAGRFEFDHGAQFFTARSRSFQKLLRPLVRAGVIAPWPARYVEISAKGVAERSRWGEDEPRYVGVPRMNVIGKALGDGLDVRYETQVSRLERQGGGWTLELVDPGGAAGTAVADWIFVCVPLSQAGRLLSCADGLAEAIGDRKMFGCHALMLGFDESIDLPFDAASVTESAISWIALNGSKPGRGGTATMLAHASNAWSEANIELESEAVLDHMIAEVSRVTGIDAGTAQHKAVHRWRYAKATHAGDTTSHWLDTRARVGVAGDWWLGGRVESAFESAQALLKAFEEFAGA